jgi:hypothetical protein
MTETTTSAPESLPVHPNTQNAKSSQMYYELKASPAFTVDEIRQALETPKASTQDKPVDPVLKTLGDEVKEALGTLNESAQNKLPNPAATVISENRQTHGTVTDRVQEKRVHPAAMLEEKVTTIATGQLAEIKRIFQSKELRKLLPTFFR